MDTPQSCLQKSTPMYVEPADKGFWNETKNFNLQKIHAIFMITFLTTESEGYMAIYLHSKILTLFPSYLEKIIFYILIMDYWSYRSVW